MNDTEQLISEALQRQAERAPHPGPTLSALRRPARKRSRSSIFLMVGTAAAAAAVLFTAGVLVGKGPSPDDGAAALLPTVAQGTPTAFKFGPTWVPDGFVEVSRNQVQDRLVRIWTLDGQTIEQAGWESVPMVSLTVGGPTPEGYENWEKVAQRHVHVGELPQQGPLATVVWKESDLLKVTVRGAPDVRETALRVAESVRPDDRASVKSAIEHRGKSVPNVWGKSPTEWTAEISSDPFRARVTTRTPDVEGGRAVVVQGKQATLLPGVTSTLAVQEGGVWLVVEGYQVTEDELVKFAEDVKITPNPDYSWLGARP